MKAAIFLSLIAAQATYVFAAPESSAEAECGALGVNDIDRDALPAGVDPNQIRKCRDHPGAIVSRNEDSGENNLFKRECWKGKSPGCSKSGYCYGNCNDYKKGEWCWLAENNGHGPWTKCDYKGGKGDEECKKKLFAGGRACGQGDCKECGCGC